MRKFEGNIPLFKYEDYKNRKDIKKHYSPNGRLVIFSYDRKIIFSNTWDDLSVTSRGLVFDVFNGRLVSRSYDKIFNLFESEVGGIDDLPNEPYDILEKLDGSMIAVFNYCGEWYFITPRSFVSSQSMWAKDWAQKNLKMEFLDTRYTYIFEAIYPQNRHVVDYGDFSGLVLTGIRNNYSGEFLSYEDMVLMSNLVGCSVVKRLEHIGIDELVSMAKTLDKNKEGFIIRYRSGFMVKVKGDVYLNLFKLKYNISKKLFWENIDISSFEIPMSFISNFHEEFMDDILKLKNDVESEHKRELSRLLDIVNTIPNFSKDRDGKKELYLYLNKEHKNDAHILIDLYGDKNSVKARKKIHLRCKPN